MVDSNLMLSSGGSSFPYVHTATNPFPNIGDFVVQLNITYTCIDDWGCGIMFSHGVPYIERSSSIFSGDGTWRNRIFTLWVADEGLDKGVIYIEMFNTLVWKTYVQGFKPSSESHLYKLTYTDGVYTVFVDGEEVASVESEVRPDTVVLGSASLYYIPFSPASMEQDEYGGELWGWCSLSIDCISIA